MHQSSFDKMQGFRNKYLREKENQPLHILDIGSQDINGSYKKLFESPNWTYIGVDVAPGNNVDIVFDSLYRWNELRSASIDVLISGQAFEHIEFFWITMLEIARVLKCGGLCCIIAPSGGYEHKYPVDCWRFYPDGFRALARCSGLDVLEAHAQWESGNYKDESNIWKDTVLISRKPNLSLWNELKANIKRSLQLRALRLGI